MKFITIRLKSVLLVFSILLTGCVAMNDDSSFDQSVPTVNSGSDDPTGQTASTYEFPSSRPATGGKIVVVDPNEHAWGAYNADGILVAQGPASLGRDYCPDINSACKTPSGTFTVFRKGDSSCKSGVFPIPEGGAPMPYCMYFHGGYALHGSDYVPNYNASHGCVRLHPSDAEWLSENFVTVGTKVKIMPY